MDRNRIARQLLRIAYSLTHDEISQGIEDLNQDRKLPEDLEKSRKEREIREKYRGKPILTELILLSPEEMLNWHYCNEMINEICLMNEQELDTLAKELKDTEFEIMYSDILHTPNCGKSVMATIENQIGINKKKSWFRYCETREQILMILTNKKCPVSILEKYKYEKEKVEWLDERGEYQTTPQRMVIENPNVTPEIIEDILRTTDDQEAIEECHNSPKYDSSMDEIYEVSSMLGNEARANNNMSKWQRFTDDEGKCDESSDKFLQNDWNHSALGYIQRNFPRDYDDTFHYYRKVNLNEQQLMRSLKNAQFPGNMIKGILHNRHCTRDLVNYIWNNCKFVNKKQLLREIIRTGKLTDEIKEKEGLN